MRKHVIAHTTAAAMLIAPVLIGVGAIGVQTASAANCDSVYPAGQAYRIGISPVSTKVKKNSVVVLSAIVKRGDLGCTGEPVAYFQKRSNQRNYNPAGSVTTRDYGRDGQGIARKSFKATKNFKWVTRYTGPGSVTSKAGTVTVK